MLAYYILTKCEQLINLNFTTICSTACTKLYVHFPKPIDSLGSNGGKFVILDYRWCKAIGVKLQNGWFTVHLKKIVKLSVPIVRKSS